MTKRERKYITEKKMRRQNCFDGLMPKRSIYSKFLKPVDFGPYEPVKVFDILKSEQ